MKKIITSILILIYCLNSIGQGYPVPQTLGRDSTLVTTPGGFKGKFINFPFTDTTQANTYPIDYYPGAQIYTTTGNSIWLRNSTASAWVQSSGGSGSISSVTFNTDSTLIICYSSG